MTLADIAKHPTRTLYHQGGQRPRRRNRSRLNAAATLALLLFAISGPSAMAADAGESLFNQACAACHSIGQGRRLGPDLHGVDERRQHEWLVRFIVDPKKVIDSGDADAQAMLKEYGNVVMPGTGMDESKAGAILQYLRDASASTKPDNFQATGDRDRGLALFIGRTALGKGGAACSACHTAAGIPLPGGGGALGPDLTAIGSRLGGEAGVAAWLTSPPTPVMRDLFATRQMTSEEARDLAAWLSASDEKDPLFKQFIRRFSRAGLFFVFAFLVAASMLAIFNLLWHRRIGSVRDSLQPVRPDQAATPNRS